MSAGSGRRHHRSLFDSWPNLIDKMEEEVTYDARTLAHYKRAKESGQLTIGDPYINPITSSPIMSVAVPVVRDGDFVGIVAASITLHVLSQFLEANRVSGNSLTLIADQSGRIIAHPIPEKGVHKAGNALEFADLAESGDIRLREAVRRRLATGQGTFHFTASTGEELNASFLDFPPELGRPWQVVVITPTDDFVGTLKATNRTIGVVIGCLLELELVLIYLLSRGLSRGLENVSRQLQAIQELKFIDTRVSPSKIREVADLQSGFSLLRNALEDVRAVRAAGRRPATRRVRPTAGIGGRAAPLTIFFSRPGELLRARGKDGAGRPAAAGVGVFRRGDRGDRQGVRHGR